MGWSFLSKLVENGDAATAATNGETAALLAAVPEEFTPVLKNGLGF